MNAVILSTKGKIDIPNIKETEINLLNKLVEIGAINLNETEIHYFLEN